jgi:PAS domain S-box-containing protein
MKSQLSTLYELSLSIGTSLNLDHNIAAFMSTLVEKTSVVNASIWLKFPKEDKKEQEVKVLGTVYSRYKDVSFENIQLLGKGATEKPYTILKKENQEGTIVIDFGKKGANEDVVIYCLEESIVFLMELSLEENEEEFLEAVLPVINKLKLSIKACLAYEQSITETERRKEIQKELEENEEKYRTVVNNIAEGLVITDLEDNLIFINKQMSKLSGYQLGDIIGQKACGIFIPEDYRDVYNRKTLRRKEGEAEEYEMLLKYKEENFWTASISATSYRNSKGDIIGTIAAINDISDRKKMELAVSREEEKYKSIIENMELGLLEVDPEERIIKAYPKFCKLTGYEEEELIGQVATDIFLDEDELNRMLQYRKARKRGESGVYEIQLKKKNGVKIWVMISGAPYFDENNNVVGSVGIHLDITQRKRVEQEIRESQEKLQLILNTSLDAIIMIDEASIVVDWSPSAEKIFGYSTHEAVGFSLDGLIVPPSMIAAHRKGMSHYMKTGEGPVLNTRVELPAIKKNGEQILIELTISPIKIDDKYYFSSFCRDITVRKKNEKALIDAKKAAEQARNVERQFLAHMSHEIRTPMNAVIGMTYLLGRSDLSAEQIDYLDALKFSADSLMGIISDILDLSKIDAGEIEMEERPFSLHHLLESLQRTYQFKVQEKNLSVQMTIDDDIKNQLIGDKTRLGQILGNLLSNASKFTSEGYIGVNALLVKREDDVFWIKFQVYDTGIGISKDSLDIIFNSFKQATVNIHREFGGTGLGLSIVKQLVEIQNGLISVESELGKGTMFEVILPFKDSGITTKEEQKIKTQISESIQKMSELTILIAEDNLINQKLITSIFSQWGIKFDLAENGLEAVEFSKQRLYDIIFMDINMPKMNGHEAVRTIKKDKSNINCNTPIITLTAAALQEERRKMFELGVYDFITKPFSPQELQQTIYSCLDKSIELDVFIDELPKAESSGTYDLSHLRKFSQGNPEFVNEMIQMFLEEVPKSLLQMESAYKEKNIKELQDLAHQLKSTFGTMGMIKQQETAKSIEHYVKKNKSCSKEYYSKIQNIVEECESIYSLLKKELL